MLDCVVVFFLVPRFFRHLCRNLCRFSLLSWILYCFFPPSLCGVLIFHSVSRLLLLLRRLRLTTLSHTSLSHTIFHTQLCHPPSFTHIFVTRHLSPTIFHTHLCHTPSFTHIFVTHHLSHTTLSPTIFHTHLCHPLSFTHIFVTHHLSHTSLSHIIFHTHLCHTPSFTHNFVPLSPTIFPPASTCVLRGTHGIYGTGLNLVARLGRFWSPVTPRHFAWQAWHLATSTVVSRGRRGTW